MTAYTLNLDVISKIDDEKFYQLCRNNPEINLERNQKGEIIIMSPTGCETGIYNAELNAEFVIWNRKYKLGFVFDSSTCFKLPKGSNRSPELSSMIRWV